MLTIVSFIRFFQSFFGYLALGEIVIPYTNVTYRLLVNLLSANLLYVSNSEYCIFCRVLYLSADVTQKELKRTPRTPPH